MNRSVIFRRRRRSGNCSLRQAEAGHFGGVSNKEFAVSDGGYVPCSVIEWLETGDFAKGIWRGIDEGDGTIFCLNEQFVVPD